jgi:hypothetical protein
MTLREEGRVNESLSSVRRDICRNSFEEGLPVLKDEHCRRKIIFGL